MELYPKSFLNSQKDEKTALYCKISTKQGIYKQYTINNKMFQEKFEYYKFLVFITKMIMLDLKQLNTIITKMRILYI